MAVGCCPISVPGRGSSKALIDTGLLVNAITQKIMAEKAFVGLLRGTVNKDGEDMVNIGAVMEYGATIKHPNGATIIIPARPFLHPVMRYREDPPELSRGDPLRAMKYVD